MIFQVSLATPDPNHYLPLKMTIDPPTKTICLNRRPVTLHFPLTLQEKDGQIFLHLSHKILLKCNNAIIQYLCNSLQKSQIPVIATPN